MLKELVLLGLVSYACGFLEFETIDTKDDEVVEAATIATEALSKKLYGQYHYRLVKILTAKKQNVGGTNFKMEVIVGLTNCRKKEVLWESLDECELQNNERIYKKCTLLVFRSINDEYKLITSSCVDVSNDEV